LFLDDLLTDKRNHKHESERRKSEKKDDKNKKSSHAIAHENITFKVAEKKKMIKVNSESSNSIKRVKESSPKVGHCQKRHHPQ